VSAPARSSARDDVEWARALSSCGPAAEAAQRDLRVVLVAGLRRALSSRGVAEDVCEDFAQEALLRIRERIASYRNESRFTTWALAIATRVAFDELRHRRWKDVSFDALTAEAREPIVYDLGADAPQERSLVRERVLAALRDAIDNDLTPRQRAVLVAELKGMPHAEVAEALGMNRNALYKLAHDARKKVKSRLLAAGVSEAEAMGSFA
jgi:RNA polymerase sigma-70 factor (ECF subfamily)